MRCLSAREDGFDGLIDPLIEAYRQAAGRDYPRPEMDTCASAANNLNNYAISMMDLGVLFPVSRRGCPWLPMMAS